MSAAIIIHSAILDMLTAGYSKADVTQEQIIHTLKRCLDFGEGYVSIMEPVNGFIYEHKKIPVEQAVRSLVNRLKACLWNRLQAFPLERQADLAKLDL